MTVEPISSYKHVNTRNIMMVNQTQPVLLSQPHLKGKHTHCAQIGNIVLINNVIVTPCSV